MNKFRPFNDAEEMYNAYLSMIDGLCSTYIAMQQSQNHEAFEGRGIVIPETQVTVALSGQKEIQAHEGFLVHLNYIQNRLSVSKTFPLTALFKKLNATNFQQMVILLALAPELNRKYERIFAYIQDNISDKRASLGLAADLYGLIDHLEESELNTLFDDQHPINRFVLTHPSSSKGLSTFLGRTLKIRQSTLLCLNEVKSLPEPLATACKLIISEDNMQPLCSLSLLEQASVFTGYFLSKADDEDPDVGLLQLFGAYGMGKTYALRYISYMTNVNILCVNCEILSTVGPELRKNIIETVLSYCYLSDYIPALTHFDFPKLSNSDKATLAQWLLKQFGEGTKFFIMCATAPLKIEYQSRFSLLQLNITPYSIYEQRDFWLKFAKELDLPLAPELDPMEMASIYSLTPGQVEEVLSVATMRSISNKKMNVSIDDIAYGVRFLCRPRLAGLTEPLKTHFTWDDLMLEDEAKKTMQQLCDRIRYRWKVKEDWGFSQKLPYGNGISVLLYGPPGTGKTMAAQVLANEFGLDAYRVDLSRIMDKYIGETEKKLSELFDAARDCNAILFFDEADALFSKRTEISDSKDKYANAETAYLLQRIEEHNGISILATNIAQNFDEAFKRRISFMINISLPSIEIRKKLWNSVFPTSAPVSRTMLDFFAERFELTGSSIKNIAVTAAYLAAANGTDIDRECLAQAIKQEYLKTGRIIMEHELY